MEQSKRRLLRKPSRIMSVKILQTVAPREAGRGVGWVIFSTVSEEMDRFGGGVMITHKHPWEALTGVAGFEAAAGERITLSLTRLQRHFRGS